MSAAEPSKGTRVAYLVLGAVAITLVAGFLLKAQCLGVWDGRQYSHLCYNDIQPLYSARAISEGIFPYVSAEASHGDIPRGSIEYPVLTGLFMWLMGTFVSNDVNGYLVVTSLCLLPFAVWTAHRLALMSGHRALLWAASPALILYAFHNWDLLVVAAAVAGIWFWREQRPIPAAIAFGVGAAFKMYPLFFLAPLALYVWQKARGKAGLMDAAKVAVAGIGTFIVINLPFMLINYDGWWATYAFHQLRAPNYDSIWALKFGFMPVPTLNLVTGALTAVSFVGILITGFVRGRKLGEFPFLQVAGALLAAFLLWNKVHSPQYTLWLLPFFALLNVNILWWAGYAAVDLLVYVGVFRFFYALQYPGPADPDPAFQAMSIGVYARALMLAALVVVMLTSRRADHGLEESTDEVVSHPPPKVSTVGDQAPA